MSLTTLTYLGFLAVCVFFFYLLPKKWNKQILLLASMAFYAYAMLDMLLVMVIYVWMIFGIGLLMKKRSQAQKPLVFLGVLLSVGILFVYKYLNFTASIFTHRDKTFSLIVPIGISYITFQCISYLVDIYKKKCAVVKNPVMFFLYAFFFTKVTAGPIESPHEFFLDIKDGKKMEWANMTQGLSLIAVGFVKKLVLADMLSPGVDAIFADAKAYDGLSVFLAAVMYSLQIYFDFSGYTDIARGSARLFGISLTENFKHPYGATSVVEFWKKWHISLSEWLKKYIYIPLGGSRVGTARRYLNVFITFLVSGIWHGAAFTFIFWGILHGLFQMVEMLLKPIRIKSDNVLLKGYRIVRTFLLVTLAWVFFRASSLSEALAVVGGIFTPWKAIGPAITNLMLTPQILILMLVAFIFVELLQLRIEKASKLKTIEAVGYSILSAWFVVAAMLLSVTVTSNSFIYFNF